MNEILIELEHVGFAYPDSEPALEDVSFTVARGEFVCVVGPNGGGKSTLLKLLLGHFFLGTPKNRTKIQLITLFFC